MWIVMRMEKDGKGAGGQGGHFTTDVARLAAAASTTMQMRTGSMMEDVDVHGYGDRYEEDVNRRLKILYKKHMVDTREGVRIGAGHESGENLHGHWSTGLSRSAWRAHLAAVACATQGEHRTQHP